MRVDSLRRQYSVVHGLQKNEINTALNAQKKTPGRKCPLRGKTQQKLARHLRRQHPKTDEAATKQILEEAHKDTIDAAHKKR